MTPTPGADGDVALPDKRHEASTRQKAQPGTGPTIAGAAYSTFWSCETRRPWTNQLEEGVLHVAMGGRWLQ